MNKPAPLPIFTYGELAQCAKREVGYRQHVYGRRVDTGAMTKEKAERELAMMRAIAAHFDELSMKTEKLL